MLKHFRCANPFPGRRHLDEHTIAANTRIVIKPDQFLGFGDGRLGIEREARVDLCADDTRNHLIDLGSDADRKAVDLVRHSLLRRRECCDFVSEFWQRRGLEQQRGIGGGVGGFKPRDGLEITRIGHDRGHGAQLFQLVHITSWASHSVLSPAVSGGSAGASAKREA